MPFLRRTDNLPSLKRTIRHPSREQTLFCSNVPSLKETLGFTPIETIQLIRDGEVGWVGSGGGGLSGILYLTPTRYTVTTRMILHSGGQLCEPF